MSITGTTTISRQELYDQVWTKPMRKLAASYGLSDVWLAKICDDHEIPRPERGHWAKKAFGKEPPRTPLPECTDPEQQTVVLQKRAPREPGPQPRPSAPIYDDDVQKVLERARSLPKVIVGTTLRNIHPLVENTKNALEGGSLDEHNMVRPHRGEDLKVISVSVSKTSVRRGLAFLDALVKTVERVGGRVDVMTSSWKLETTITFCGDQATTIRLRERYRQVPRSTPPKSAWDWQKYEFHPTGRLLLDRAANSYGQPHCQDTEKTRRIEDQINGVVIRWIEEVGRQRILRRKAEEERRHREEEERLRRGQEAELRRRREDLAAKQRAEQARVDRLCADAAAWKQSQSLREFISTVEQAAATRSDSQPSGEFAQWLDWARHQADRLDPFTPSPSSILDERL